MPVPISLGGGGLLGAVELGVVVLPGSQGAPATVADVPLGREADAVVVVEPVVEPPAPLLAVAEVLPVEGVLLVVVEVVVLLLEGVHGAAVVDVPV